MVTKPIFISGIGTGIGKTLAAAIVAEALEADYWKPVQAGDEDGTDRGRVEALLSNSFSVVHPELYCLKMPASPHIAAHAENIRISISDIQTAAEKIQLRLRQGVPLVIEGAGGLLVPLNEQEMVADAIRALGARLILVSRHYLGSINHSLLTASVCRMYNLDVLGWIFNDRYMAYEDEIVGWSGFPKIGSLPFASQPGKTFVREQAQRMSGALKKLI